MDGLVRDRLDARGALRLAGVFVAALVVVIALVAAGVYLWLRTYTPLGTTAGSVSPGPGVGAVIEPAVGSGGKTVFFPAYRKGRDFVASFTLHNGGHFTVTVEGLVPEQPDVPPWIGPVELLSTDSVSTGTPVTHTRRFRPFELSAGDSAVLVARFRTACPARRARVPSVFADTLRLRYTYARWFTRTQRISLPFAVTLRCVGGPLAKP
ncbi:MAG TPA: hypothetical protein VFJ77_11640 [Gaiellaceae bacterium]|nr:hypothetical protein [Gaiellaceae bacterium]